MGSRVEQGPGAPRILVVGAPVGCGEESLDWQWWFECLENSCNTGHSEDLGERLRVAKSLEN